MKQVLRYVVLLGCAIFNFLLADEASLLCVSLGSHCDTVLWLKTYGLRQVAYPLDWLLTTDIERFIELIESDFDGFLDRSYFIASNKTYIHTYYHIEFRHEGQSMDVIFEKYPRRIERFRQLGASSQKVCFIRSSFPGAFDPALYWPTEEGCYIRRNDAERLYETLQRFFPSLDFHLLILNYDGAPSCETYGHVVMCEGCRNKEWMIQIFETLAAGRIPNQSLTWSNSTDER